MADTTRPSSLSVWLREPIPTSSWQARAQQLWLSWRAPALQSVGDVRWHGVDHRRDPARHLRAPLSPPTTSTRRTCRSACRSRRRRHGSVPTKLGRDVYSRLVFGARITLYIACLTAVIAAPIGLMVGTTDGYIGGWVDTVLMRIVDVFLAFPSLILALASSPRWDPASRMPSSPFRWPPGRRSRG